MRITLSNSKSIAKEDPRYPIIEDFVNQLQFSKRYFTTCHSLLLSYSINLSDANVNLSLPTIPGVEIFRIRHRFTKRYKHETCCIFIESYNSESYVIDCTNILTFTRTKCLKEISYFITHPKPLLQ